jgi:hypothetical protein
LRRFAAYGANPLWWRSVGVGEFEGYEFGLLAGVGYGVGVVAENPFGFAGSKVDECGDGLAFDVAAKIDVGGSDDQVWAVVVMLGDHGAGLEFDFGDADGVFNEEDLFGASGKSFEAAVFVFRGIPRRGCGAEGCVF